MEWGWGLKAAGWCHVLKIMDNCVLKIRRSEENGN
jgi:hypothetical protein